MHHKTSIERILAIEKAMDVTAIRYKGLRLWPYIRLQLWRRLIHPNSFAPPATIGLRHLAQKLSQSFFKPEIYAPYLEHAKRHRDNLSMLAKRGHADVLFFSRLEEHTDKIRGRYVNRYIDPLADLLKTKYTYLKLEFSSDASSKTMPRYEHTHFLDTLEYIRCDAQRSLINAFQKDGNGSIIEGGEQLTNVLGGIRFDLALTEEYLMVEAERLLHYGRYFKELLEVVKPKAVFMTGYYQELSMALISACKELGIATIDVQREGIGAFHGMYTHWEDVPEEGYTLLPDYFWCWSKFDVERIQQWKSSLGTHHHPVIGGNRWLAKWIDEGPKMPGKSAEQYLRKLDPRQRRILVSLRDTEDCLPDNLVEAIRLGPPEWHWLIRVYPGKEQKIDEIASLFYDLKVSNVEITLPSKIPVYRLLKYVDWHVCQWSTVAIEALRLGVPTLIIHPEGRELYKQHIEGRQFIYAETYESIIEHITSDPPEIKQPGQYVVTDRIYALDALLR